MNSIFNKLLGFISGKSVAFTADVVERSMKQLLDHGATLDQLSLVQFGNNEYLLKWETKGIGYKIGPIFTDTTMQIVAEPFDFEKQSK